MEDEKLKVESKTRRNDFIKKLELPQFDEKENPEEVRERLFKDDKLGEEERLRLLAEKKKREEAINNWRNITAVAEDDAEKKKGVRLFVGWTRMLAVFKGIYEDVVADTKRRREEQIAFFERFVKIYVKVAKAWASRAVRKPYIAIMGDREQPLRFDDNAMAGASLTIDKHEEFKRRFMFTQVRVKGIILDLVADTTVDKIPEPLLLFLNGVTT